MPRGYLKHRARTVGNNAARGNGSRRATFHRTPGYHREQKASATRQASAFMKEYTDECIRSGLDYYFDNDDVSNSGDFNEMEDYPFPLRSELAFSFANRKETTEQLRMHQPPATRNPIQSALDAEHNMVARGELLRRERVSFCPGTNRTLVELVFYPPTKIIRYRIFKRSLPKGYPTILQPFGRPCFQWQLRLSHVRLETWSIINHSSL